MLTPLLLCLLVAAALAPFWRASGWTPRVIVTLACAGALGLGVWASPAPVAVTPHRPLEARDAGYVSSDSCRACHPGPHDSWHRSYHRTMTQLATPEAFAADFDGVEVTLWGQRYKFERRGDTLWVDMPDPSSSLSAPHRALTDAAAERAPRVERPVVMTTGSHHYQVLWVPLSLEEGEREVINLRIVYLIDDQRWIPRTAAFLSPPEIRQGTVAWAAVCIKCHATRGRPGYDGAADVVDFGIACESCHGPGEAHVARNQNPLRRFTSYLTEGPDDSVVNPVRLPHDRASYVCAQCHSLLSIPDADAYRQRGLPYHPGEDIHEHLPNLVGELLTETQRNERMWADGDLRVTGGEWVGMAGSRCFTEGELACTSCHSMHDSDPNDQLAAGMDGDDACASCHAPATYAAEAHTHHPARSSGSRCYNCHMPNTTYGLLKAVRSHRIDSPNVTRSLETRKPNACNLCHLDRTLAWTAEALTRWYGQATPKLTAEHRQVSEALALLLRGDAGQRALIAWAMGWGPAREASDLRWMAPYLTFTLNDPYDAVRIVGYRALKTLPGFTDFAFDPIAPEEQRIELASEIIPRWHERQGSDLEGLPPEVLIDPREGLMRGPITALLQRRDNRPVMLSE
ncbi:MAG: hypothetical protein KC636_37170 [Myxococcales bacterium]|nr:hypothetical protein [Myxococcales bacterium]